LELYMSIQSQIMKCLQDGASAENGYINPNFLSAVSALLEVYYGLSDDGVDRWIYDMHSA